MHNGGAPSVIVQRSEIVDNGSSGITNTHSALTVDARHNWWGSVSGPSSDTIYGDVLYRPWLTNAPDCSPITTTYYVFLPTLIKP